MFPYYIIIMLAYMLAQSNYEQSYVGVLPNHIK